MKSNQLSTARSCSHEPLSPPPKRRHSMKRMKLTCDPSFICTADQTDKRPARHRTEETFASNRHKRKQCQQPFSQNSETDPRDSSVASGVVPQGVINLATLARRLLLFEFQQFQAVHVANALSYNNMSGFISSLVQTC